MVNKIILANSQKYKILEGGRPFLDTLDMRLYVADITPTGLVQPASPTDECGDSGYAPVNAVFPNPAVTVGTVGQASGPTITYTFSHSPGDFTVFGVFWTDPGDGDVTVMAWRDPTPFPCAVAGQVYLVPPVFCLDTGC